MSNDIRQRRIIDNLNDYFKWHNLPVEMNKTGICNGLASVYAKFALKGETEQFYKMLQYISGETPSLLDQEKVNQFAQDILLSYVPEFFNKKLNQLNSIESLSINHKPLSSSFDLAITTNDQQWAKIMETMDLQEGEVMLVRSIDHVVSVSRKDRKYIIYDPNYSTGFREFDNEQQLVQELHQAVFEYETGPLGMKVSVVRHPEHPPRAFPNVTELCQRYQTADMLTYGVKKGSHEFKMLEQAASIGEAETMTQLIEIGRDALKKEDLLVPAFSAVKNNNTKTLRILLSHIDCSDENNKMLILFALRNGRKEAFDELLRHEPFQLSYISLISNLYVGDSIRSAVSGGNPELLTEILTASKQSYARQWGLVKHTIDVDKLTNSWMSQKLLELDKDAVDEAINSGSIGCVRILFEHINNETENLTPEQQKIWADAKLRYLQKAIQKNHPQIVEFLIKTVPRELLQKVSVTPEEVNKMDLSIVRNLQENGVGFSPPARKVIAEKAHLRVGFVLSIKVMLINFYDFIVLSRKSSLSSYEKVNPIESIDKYNVFREKFKDLERQADTKYGDQTSTISIDDFLKRGISPRSSKSEEKDEKPSDEPGIDCKP